jgi:hypothetical protein
MIIEVGKVSEETKGNQFQFEGIVPVQPGDKPTP